MRDLKRALKGSSAPLVVAVFPGKRPSVEVASFEDQFENQYKSQVVAEVYSPVNGGEATQTSKKTKTIPAAEVAKMKRIAHCENCETETLVHASVAEGLDAGTPIVCTVCAETNTVLAEDEWIEGEEDDEVVVVDEDGEEVLTDEDGNPIDEDGNPIITDDNDDEDEDDTEEASAAPASEDDDTEEKPAATDAPAAAETTETEEAPAPAPAAAEQPEDTVSVDFKPADASNVEAASLVLAQDGQGDYWGFNDDVPALKFEEAAASDGAKAMWDSPAKFQTALVLAAKDDGLTEEVLANFGGRFISVALDVPRARAQKIEAARLEIQNERNSEVASVADDYTQSLEIAMMGIDKGIFGSDMRNPVVATLVADLNALNVKGAESLVLSAFRKAGVDHLSMINTKAQEIAAMGVEARNAIGHTVETASYPVALNFDEGEEVIASLSDNKLIDEPAPAKKKPAPTTEIASGGSNIRALFARSQIGGPAAASN